MGIGRRQNSNYVNELYKFYKYSNYSLQLFEIICNELINKNH